MNTVHLRQLCGLYAVCRLSANTPVPEWVLQSSFFSVTRSAQELSVVCRQTLVPDRPNCERNWSGFYVAGPLDFTLIGILARLASPLAAAGIPILAISSYDTDYLFVKNVHRKRALHVLKNIGCVID